MATTGGRSPISRITTCLADPDWAQGYHARSAYFDTVQPEMCPAAIDLALLVAGRRPPRDGPGFRFAELGCGTAGTLIGLAALYPQARFLGIDFMPEHVAQARALVAAAGLGNIEIREASFADLVAAPDPEPFDYVALHGVWSWVSPGNRAHLATLIGRWVRPGGVAFVSYNCMAGWAEAAPIRRIFREAPPGPSDAPFGPARAAVEAWLAQAATPSLTETWQRLSALPDRYLAHDLGAEHDAPIWQAELCAALAPVKADFLCSAMLHEQFDPLRFDGETLGFVRSAAAEGWGELARDLAARRTFRLDLFGRGVPRLAATEQRRRLRAMPLAAWPARLRFEGAIARSGMLRDFEPETRDRIAAAFEAGSETVGDVAHRLGLSDTAGLQTVLLVLARGEARIVDAAPAGAGVDRLRAALAAMWRDGAAPPGVPAPRLGLVVPLTAEERGALFGGAATALRGAFARLGLD